MPSFVNVSTDGQLANSELLLEHNDLLVFGATLYNQ